MKRTADVTAAATVGAAQGCGCGGHCGPNGCLWDQVHQPSRFWVALEYVGLRSWKGPTFRRGDDQSGRHRTGVAGRLPDATVLFGNTDIDDDWRHGGELRLGWWLVDGQFCGIEGHYMTTESAREPFLRRRRRSRAGSFSPAILDQMANVRDSADRGLPGLPVGASLTSRSDGSVRVESASDIQSAGLIMRHVLWADFERNFRSSSRRLSLLPA